MNTREDYGDEAVRELIPDWVAGRLDEPTAAKVSAAVDGDPDLADEARVLRALDGARVDPPEWLKARIVDAVRADRPEDDVSRSRAGRGRGTTSARVARGWSALPRWGFAAAAVAVLVVGLTEVAERPVDDPDEPLDEVALEDVPNPWMGGEDGAVFIAGAPVFDELSDDELLALLQDLGG